MDKETVFIVAVIAGLWYLNSQKTNTSSYLPGGSNFVGPLQGGGCPAGFYQATTLDGQPVCLPVGAQS